MVKKRRKFNFDRSRLEGFSSTVNSSLAKFYGDKIHITRSIDEYLSRNKKGWSDQPQEERYKKIHIALGVQWLFELAE